MNQRTALLVIILLCSLLSPVIAVDPMGNAKDLALSLDSPNKEQVAKAVKEIERWLDYDPDSSIHFLRKYWLKPLHETKRYDLIERLSLLAIVSAPDRTRNIVVLQEVRVRALLASGRPAEALSQAKSLFNLTEMRNTAKSLLLVAECLKAVHPQDPQVLGQLAREQKIGAVTRLATESPAIGGLLNGIRIDAASYEAMIKKLDGFDDERALLAKGNLLLLSGRAKEAKAVFQRMLELSKEPDLALHENIARAIRAEDGNIGRANGYLLALPDNQRVQPRE